MRRGMVFEPIARALTEPRAGDRGPWLALTLAIALLPALEGLREGLAHPATIQDDARHFVVWLRSALDPELFAGDTIAEYFRSVSPWGFSLFYRVAAQLGLDPVTVSLYVPVPLYLLMAAGCFGLAWRIAANGPMAFFAASLVVLLLAKEDLVAPGIPRSFGTALFPIFLWALVARATISMATVMVLLAATYPQAGFLASVVLGLSLLDDRRFPWLSRSPRQWGMVAVGGAAAVASALPFLIASSRFGPVIEASEARGMAMFQADGRSAFFLDPMASAWLCSSRAGFIPEDWCSEGTPWPLLLAEAALLALPPLLLLTPGIRRALARFGERGADGLAARLPVLLFVGGGLLFLAAHVLLFELHLPARYPHMALRIAAPLALGLLLALSLARWSEAVRAKGTAAARRLVSCAYVFVGLTVVLPTLLDTELPNTNYVQGRYPKIYGALEAEPKDTLVVGIVREIENVPAFASRSVLVARELFIPYSKGYFMEMRERLRMLAHALGASGRQPLATLAERYGVDLILMERKPPRAALADSDWLNEDFPTLAREIASKSEDTSFVGRHYKDCTTSQERDLALVDVGCLLER